MHSQTVESSSIELMDLDVPQFSDEIERDDEMKRSGIALCDEVEEFKNVRNFEGFKIVANGVLIDSEISVEARVKYYKLCRSQNEYIHDGLIKGTSCELVAGLIIELVAASEAILSIRPNTSLEKLANCDRILKICEYLDMEVGFLRRRFNDMVEIHSEHTKKMKMKMADEAELVEVKAAIDAIDAELNALKGKVAAPEPAILKVAKSPW